MLLTPYGTYPCEGGSEQIIGNGDIARRGCREGRPALWHGRGQIGGRRHPVFKRPQFQVTGKRLLSGQLLFTPKGIVSLLGLQILGRGLTEQRRGEDQAECPNGDRP